MANFNGDEVASLESSAPRIGVFFRLETAPIVRLWLGIGHIAATSTREPSGATYTGFGELRDVPAFNQVINGRAERIEVSLSGVTDEMVQAFLEEDVDTVKHKPADMGIGVMGGDWGLLGDVHWLRRGYVDYPALSHESGSGPDEPDVRVISLSIGGLMTGRRRAGLSYWTDRDQQRRSSGDLFCKRTEIMNEIEKVWPRF